MATKPTLTNDDFRKLLATPRPGAQPESHAKPEQQKPPQKQDRRPLRPAKEPDEATNERKLKEKKDAAAYRDRAAERRMGVNIDEADVGAADMSYDESKYLGGDMEHTHLVKGLDYALLNKTREDVDDAQGEVTVDNNSAGGVGSAPAFVTPLGRAVYDFFFPQPQQPLRPMDLQQRFLPHRMAFLYNLSATSGDCRDEVPTTLYRAKEDRSTHVQAFHAMVDAEVMQKLTKGLELASLAGKKRARRKDKRTDDQFEAPQVAVEPVLPPLQPPKAIEDDADDIFAEAGTDYVAERRQQPASIVQSHSPKRYFEGQTTVLEEKDFTTDKSDIQVATVASVTDKQRQAKEASQRAALLIEEQGNDAYAECYPSYYSAAGTAYDSEEEAEGRAAAGDAATDEHPVQAKRRDAVKQAAKESSKMASELSKIQQIFENKGYKHDEAFEEAAQTKDREDTLLHKMPTKKRRI